MRLNVGSISERARSSVRIRRSLAACIAGGLLSLCSIAASAAGGRYSDVLGRDWHVFESKHFRVISDDNERTVGRYIHDLELFRTYVRATMGMDENRQSAELRYNRALRQRIDARQVPEHERVDVYLFSRRAHLIRLFNSRDVFAFMQPGLRKSHMVIAPDYDSPSPNSVAFHEYVHFLMRAVGGSHFPPWYEEGLAEFFAATTIEEDALIIGDIPELRLQNLHTRHRYPVDDVFVAGAPGLLSEFTAMAAPENQTRGDRRTLREQKRRARLPNSPNFYAQSWSMIHMLLLGHHAGMPRRDHLLTDYVLDIQNGGEPEAALTRHFNGQYRVLEADLRRYLSRRSRIPRLSIPLNQFDYDPRYKRRPLQRTELTNRLGRLAAPLSSVSARGIFRAALAQEPTSPEILAGMGVAQRFAGRLDKAVALVSQSLERAPDNAVAHFEFADTVSVACQRNVVRKRQRADTQIDCNELVPKAMASYAKALALAPDNPEFQANYGVALLQGGELSAATALLRQAFETAPWSPGLSFALGESLRRQGEFARAKPLLNRAAVWFFKNPGLRLRAQAALALAEQELKDVPGGGAADVQLKTLN